MERYDARDALVTILPSLVFLDNAGDGARFPTLVLCESCADCPYRAGVR